MDAVIVSTGERSHLATLITLYLKELKVKNIVVKAVNEDHGRILDRVGAHEVIFPDRQLMLFAADVLARNPGAQIIYDVKSTRLLAPWIERHGGEPVIWKTGHSFIV